jgi:hypothetical protein
MNDESNQDLAALRALPAHDVDLATRAHVERTARAAFVAAHDGSFGAKVSLLWSRVGVPMMLASVVVVYLGWAVQAAAGLYR